MDRKMKSIHGPLASLLLLAVAAPAGAQDRPVPYWASLRVDEVNMRVGPGEDYRIQWVYRRKQLPMKVVRLKEGWRLVEDPEGAQGWMLARFLTPDRGAIVQGKGLAEMHDKPDAGSRLRWRLEPGVTGALGDCDGGWCEFTVTAHHGYVKQDRLWGAGEP
jgi:SH3-like domain-containing protein